MSKATLPHPLPYTGGDAVHDTQTPGQTNSDNYAWRAKCLLLCLNIQGFMLGTTHQTTNSLITPPF